MINGKKVIDTRTEPIEEETHVGTHLDDNTNSVDPKLGKEIDINSTPTCVTTDVMPGNTLIDTGTADKDIMARAGEGE